MKLGPYDVLGELGRGGMGVVLHGRSPRGEDVALKLLQRIDAATLARFERERRLLGLFTAREGFVPLLDAGTSPEGAYLVMPLLRGGTLRQRLERGPIEVEDTIELGKALSGAIGRAHGRGVVHRDLKPENVLFDGEGQPVSRPARPLIADLGLAKHFAGNAPGASQSVSLSRSGDLRGTAGYMAPEQIADAKRVGPASDVFALGAILYECLAGVPAFQGENTVEVLARIAAGSRQPLGSARPDAPPWLVRVIERALATDPARRFMDGNALAFELDARGTRRASRGWALALGGAALAVLVALGVSGRASPPTPTPPPSPANVLSPEPRLPDRLKAGGKVTLPDGKEVELFLWELPGSAGTLELVRVPAGDFAMGADDADASDEEKPRHTHPMERSFWIGRNDVTWKQYLAYCEAANAPRPERPDWAGDDHPVVSVSWDDAMGYCGWAKLTLPSEAEWEKAARGADGRRYPWGGEPGPAFLNLADRSAPTTYALSKGGTIDLAWRDASVDDGWAYTSPVGAYPKGASPCGALDMSGNVWQWCEDSYEERAYDRYARGDFAPPSGPFRLFRGGSWWDMARRCRPSYRVKSVPQNRDSRLGFRVALRAT